MACAGISPLTHRSGSLSSDSLPVDEATSLARFFAVKDDEEYPYEYITETQKWYIEDKEVKSLGYLSAAKRLFESKDVNCILCHVKEEKMPEGDPSGWGARPHASQEEAQAQRDKTLAPRPTINTTRHKDAQVF
ncbi:MAG: hypothetical protein Q6358_01925 [Candidatus Brocadiales bacterium]|nr:hypothetical protein [Candidatus Brocadiales bacterium]